MKSRRIFKISLGLVFAGVATSALAFAYSVFVMIPAAKDLADPFTDAFMRQAMLVNLCGYVSFVAFILGLIGMLVSLIVASISKRRAKKHLANN